MKRPLPWDNQVDLVSSDDSSSSDSDVETDHGQLPMGNLTANQSPTGAPAQQPTTDATNEPAEILTSEGALVRRASMYQEYMKQLPVPTLRGSLIPCNSWMGLAKSIKELYGQPLHYLTNKLLKQWDQARLEAEDHHKPLDNIIHPVKAEANIWLIEEVHRLTASHDHIARLWLQDPISLALQRVIAEQNADCFFQVTNYTAHAQWM
ncbi:hypothetical protein Ancab_030350 [Ancistrocladus abbreviatus]